MKTKQILLAFVCLGCAFCLLNSCSKNLELVPSLEDESSTEIQLKNGILVFPSRIVLSEVLGGKEDVQMNQFVEVFASQKDMMDEVMQAELEYIAYLDTLKIEAFEKVSQHSRVYNDYLQQGIIKQFFYNDNTYSYDLNLADAFYAKVVNKEGFFAVGDTIFQITPRYKKIWIGGDLNNCNLLDSYTESNEIENIFVIDYTQKETILPSVGLSRTNFPITIKDQNIGMYVSPNVKYTGNLLRFIFVFYDKTTPIFARKSYLRDTYCRVVCQELIDNAWVYIPKRYDYDFTVTIVKDNVENDFYISGSNTGENDYYAVYTMYQMMAAGRDPLEYDGEYYQIKKFDCMIYYVELFGTAQVAVVPGISMRPGMTIPFDYSYQYHSDATAIGWLNEIIPE